MAKIGSASAKETRQLILIALKRHGSITIAALAARLRLTDEAVRQHIVQLVAQELVEMCRPRSEVPKKMGRPPVRYCLTVAGDHLFPKHYDALTLDIFETILRTWGSDAIEDVLAMMADKFVQECKPATKGKTLRQRIDVIRERFKELDRHISVEKSDGSYRVIEHNCPFLNVALERPELCSVAVNIFTRLLGCEVVRVERYQNGDGRCVFDVNPKRRSRLKRFVLEPPLPVSP